MTTPDPRETSLPKWAQSTMHALRQQVADLQEQNAALGAPAVGRDSETLPPGLYGHSRASGYVALPDGFDRVAVSTEHGTVAVMSVTHLASLANLESVDVRLEHREGLTGVNPTPEARLQVSTVLSYLNVVPQVSNVVQVRASTHSPALPRH